MGGYRRIHTRLVAVVTALGALTLLPGFAAAQPPRTAAENAARTALERSLRLGDKVTVTQMDGQFVKGKVVEVTPDQLRLAQDGSQRRIGLGDIHKVQRKRMGVKLGTLIGLAVGVGSGALAGTYAENEAGDGVFAFLSVAAMSTAAGFGIDAAVNIPRTVYQRDRKVTVAPIVTPRGAGVGVRMTF